MLNKISIKVKLLFLIISIMVIVFSGGLKLLQDSLSNYENGKIDKIQSVIDSSYTVLENMYNKEKALGTTDQEIKNKYFEFTEGLRFDGSSGYIFIYDSKGVNLEHPVKPSLEGRNLIELKDANGKFLIKDIIKVAKSEGQGLVDFYFAKPGIDTPQPKVAYIKYFFVKC